MYLGDTHTDGHTNIELLAVEFDREIERIILMHRYVIKTAARDFGQLYERLLAAHNYEDSGYDGGDAIWDTEQELGVNPWDVEEHFGLLSLARAVSLAEIVLARLAAACWERLELTVFPQGRTWPRQWEVDFYKTCLRTKFDSNGRGFETLRRLRDLYMHGYGVPVREVTFIPWPPAFIGSLSQVNSRRKRQSWVTRVSPVSSVRTLFATQRPGSATNSCSAFQQPISRLLHAFELWSGSAATSARRPRRSSTERATTSLHHVSFEE